MVLVYPGRLPPGALISEPARPATVAPPPARPDPAPVWLMASEGIGLSASGRLAEWQGRGGAVARPVSFNDEGNEVEPGRAVCFPQRSHGGLVIETGDPADCFTLALIYARERRDPLTIAAMQATGDEDYTFLSVDDGKVRLGQKESDAGLSVPDPGGLALVMLSVGAGQAALSVNGGPARRGGMALQGGALRLFLGCRGDARPLLNKLGPFRLSDALYWPGQALLADGVSGGVVVPVIRLWQERQRHGL
jgi:hypothetical protein